MLLLASCGRLDFDPLRPDAGADGPTAAPAIIQSAANLGTNTSTVSLSLAPTQAGDLLVVATGGFGPGNTIQAITDNAGNTYVSANAQSHITNLLSDVVEIWYATNSLPGATSLSVEGTASSIREAWFVEASQLSALDTVVTVNDAASSTMPVMPPLAPTTVPALIVAIGDFAGDVTKLHAGSPFTQLTIQDGNDAAVVLATTAATYMALWDGAGPGTYCVSAAAFR